MTNNQQALISYMFIMSITPGPNNIVLMASGIHFGIKRSLPYLFGVMAGFFLQSSMIYLVAHAFIDYLPKLGYLFAYTGLALSIYMSYELLRPSGLQSVRPTEQPPRLVSGMTFQAINPKSWLFALNLAAILASSAGPASALASIGLGILMANGPAMLLWIISGTTLNRLLSGKAPVRTLNTLMAATLLCSTAISLWNTD